MFFSETFCVRHKCFPRLRAQRNVMSNIASATSFVTTYSNTNIIAWITKLLLLSMIIVMVFHAFTVVGIRFWPGVLK